MDIQTVYQNFLQELKDANAGKQTSLPFIKNSIPSRPLVKEDEIFQVMVIGGTIFRTGIMQRQKNDIVILHIESEHLPLFPNKETFLKFVEKNAKKDIRVLAINFAYPLMPVFENDRLDGILLAPNKGNAFEGLINERVGTIIEGYLYEKRKQNIIVSVANDTAGLVLSGLTTHKWNEIAGGIVGTGANFAFMLDNHTVVNLESGTFSNFKQSAGGKYTDIKSSNPGKYLFEKEISGKYLYDHFNYLVEQGKIKCNPLKSTLQLSILAEVSISGISEYAQEILANAAQLVAAEIAAILSFSQRDLFFIMQGSVFWKAYQFEEVVKEWVEKLEPNYLADFIRIDNADLFGGAKLIA